MKKREAERLMGQVVTVSEVYQRETTGRYPGKIHRVWSRTPVRPPRAGWVVGVRTLYEGQRIPGGFEEKAHLKIGSAFPCLLVAFQPRFKPVRVPLDGYTLGGQPDNREQQNAWPEQYRQEMREIARAMPRNEKGQFVRTRCPDG